MAIKNRGFFITFEGIDGCGKTTQAKLLAEYLKTEGFAVLHTREPGGNNLAEKIREIVLDPEHKISPLAELFLYQAARSEHTELIIIPALAAGKTIICERYTDATIAYQGFGRGLPLKIIQQLNAIATKNIKPQLTILLDLRPESGLNRRMARTNQKTDRLENENIAFHRRVRQGYLRLAKSEPGRIKIFSAIDSVEKTRDLIREYVRKKLN
ncbi:MAG: dTMP kinase [Elusimicrobiota bacterium]